MSRQPTAALGATYERAPQAEDVVWQLQGLCGQYDADLWQPANEMEAYAPKQICHRCPVMIQCRTWALENHEQAGVWGGLSENERASIWAGRTIRHRKRSA